MFIVLLSFFFQVLTLVSSLFDYFTNARIHRHASLLGVQDAMVCAASATKIINVQLWAILFLFSSYFWLNIGVVFANKVREKYLMTNATVSVRVHDSWTGKQTCARVYIMNVFVVYCTR